MACRSADHCTDQSKPWDHRTRAATTSRSQDADGLYAIALGWPTSTSPSVAQGQKPPVRSSGGWSPNLALVRTRQTIAPRQITTRPAERPRTAEIGGEPQSPWSSRADGALARHEGPASRYGLD